MGATGLVRNFASFAGGLRVGDFPHQPSVTACRQHAAIIGHHSSPSAVIDGHDPPRPVELNAIMPDQCEKTITSCVYNECPRFDAESCHKPLLVIHSADRTATQTVRRAPSIDRCERRGGLAELGQEGVKCAAVDVLFE